MAEILPGPKDAVAPELLGRLAARYPGLGTIRRILRNATSANSLGCLFATSLGEFFLKGLSPSKRLPAELLQEHRIVQHLCRHNFPTPPILANAAGETLTQESGYFWTIYHAAAGEDRYCHSSVFAPFDALAEVHSAGATLARFHLALSDLPALPPRPFQGIVARYELAWAEDLHQEIAGLLANRPPAWDFLVNSPDFIEALRLFDRLREGLPDRRSRMILAHGLIHGDWIKRNLFFKDNEVSAVIDIELCNWAPLAYDLALAISAAAFPWQSLLAGEPPRLADAAVMQAGYESVRKLSPAEAQSLPVLLATCRFEFHLALLALAAERGDLAQAAWYWEGQLSMLRWWQRKLGC
ncbi:MAG: phosphotransferase [Cyanobacteria bacterium NC_groundwater_1444_Ag_S-0.65um_54_12]|nr:phosphotransferase [Cyanobacteria bacterium NC_groundwater_1444_Ag_S-0.65um_54_12]